MFDEDKKNDNNNDRKGGDFRVSSRTWLVWIAILATIPLLMFLKKNSAPAETEMTRSQFFSLVSSNLIDKGVIALNPQGNLHEIEGAYLVTTKDGKQVMTKDGKPETKPFHIRNVYLGEKDLDLLMPTGSWKPGSPTPCSRSCWSGCCRSS
jgi:hypothetical protein